MKKDNFALKNFLKTKIGNKNHFYYEHPEDNSFKWEGTAWDKAEARSKAKDSYEKHTGKRMEEDAPANSAGAGNVAALGVGPKGEPGRSAQMMPMVRRGKFAGKPTFIVSSTTFNSLKEAKRMRKHWRTYLNEDDAYHDLREYAKSCKGPIIVEDELTGCCMFVRYGNGGSLF